MNTAARPALIKLRHYPFITGLGAFFIAAPAIVRVQNIMPVKAFDFDAVFEGVFRSYAGGFELVDVTRRAFVPRLFVDTWIADPMLGELRLDNIKRSE